MLEKKRSLKVYYGYHSNSSLQIPVIRLAGQYLQKMGFKIGDRIDIYIEKDKISIRKVLPSEDALEFVDEQLQKE